MRSLFSVALQTAFCASLLLGGMLAQAAEDVQASFLPAPAVLIDQAESPYKTLPLQAWLDPMSTASIDSASGIHSKKFAPALQQTIYPLNKEQTLWLRLRVTQPEGNNNRWQLTIPLPLLDKVTLYQQDAQGKWVGQTAGDTLPNALWPESGRYPQFHLQIAPGQTKPLYLRVQHVTPLSLPITLVSEETHHFLIQTEYLGLGMVFGAMLLMMLACIAQSWVYDDATYAWYALYTAIMTLAVASYTGVAGHLLWRYSGAWTDASQGSLGILGSASAQLFIWHLCAIGGRYRRFSKTAKWVGIAGVAAALLYLMVDRGSVGIWVIAAAFTLTMGFGLTTAVLSWRRGDEVGKWVLIAYTPMALAALLALTVVLGWLSATWITQYAVVLAMGMEVPLLLVALNLRSRARHGAQAREEALATQDALTGLLAPHLFQDRMAQVVARFNREKNPAAIVFIDLVNYARVKSYFGSAVAEQSLLRSVIKLRRLMRDVDTISRISEARFGLIMEGVSSRHTVTQRSAQLIAAGLMPLKGLKPQITLQFHVAAVLLGERIMDPQSLGTELGRLLTSMSSRTRRPIRFLEPENTVLMPLEEESQRQHDIHSDFPPVH
ncbi:MAG: 7TM diverse intracellular signaling domain-containing protein [Burkholderiaceae bacterium]